MSEIRIAVASPAHNTSIMIDGKETHDVERFIMQQHIDDEFARLELTRVLVDNGEIARSVDSYPGAQHDIEIIGIADVVELFEDEARRAAAEQRIAISSFWIHEGGDDPVLATLGELIEDAKRYRSLQRYLDGSGDDRRLVALQQGNRDQYVAGGAADLDQIADMLRRDYYGKHVEGEPKPKPDSTS